MTNTTKMAAFVALLLATGTLSASDTIKVDKQPYRGSNTKQTDIIHTRLDVSFDWEKSRMNGNANITARPHFYSTSKLNLNARGMDIKSLEVYDLGKGAIPDLNTINPEILRSKKLSSTYVYQNDSLKIDLGKTFSPDEKYQVRINYVAKPDELSGGGSAAITSDKGLYFINPRGTEKNKMPQIWTQGETQASSAWFPTIDSPNEKMTQDIYMTVDSKYTTLSNGKLIDSKKNSNGSRTDHWKMDLPHSPYLAMMAVGEFVKVTDEPWNGKEISYYVEKEYAPHAKAIFGNTKEMIAFYSKVLGTPYPWQKYAQIVVRDYVSGAMENTSATLHGDFMVYQTDREIIDGKKGEDVIAHELFHQWFGDLVTAESWSNLPLNESFATYGEYLWEEFKNGRDAADAHGYKSRMGYLQQSQKQVNLIRYHYNDKEDMFDAFSYNKGGQVLHMLRKYTGDEAFFASLKLYLEKNKFRSAEIHDLRLAFEEVTGEDLNWFFDEWFLSKGHPDLEITREYKADQGLLLMKVKQKQDLSQFPLYTLPLYVDLYHSGKKERVRITINEKEQEFSFKVPVLPDLVNFDAERQLLCTKTYNKTDDELLFQYNNAPLFLDRYEALIQLRAKIDKPEVYNLYTKVIRNDPWFELRGSAISYLKPVAAAHEEELKKIIQEIALNDKSTNVRALALDFLSSNYKDAALEDLYVKSLNDRSYKVIAASLLALNNTNGMKAYQNAKKLEGEKNHDVFAAIASVYGRNGADGDFAYFEKIRENFSGFTTATYLYNLGKFMELCKEPQTFEKAAAIYKESILTANEYIKPQAIKGFEERIIKPAKARVVEYKDSDPARSAAFAALAAKLDTTLKEVTAQ
jgi:aminopeptidase N